MSYITFTIPDDNLVVEHEYINIMTQIVQLHNEIIDMKPLKLKSIVLRSVSSKIDKLLDDIAIMNPILYINDNECRYMSMVDTAKYIVDTVEKSVDECPICYERMFDCIKTCCGHIYCKTCYDKINTCALCRTDLGKPVLEFIPNQEDVNTIYRIIEAFRSIVNFDISDENAVRHAINIALARAHINNVNLNDIEITIENYLNRE